MDQGRLDLINTVLEHNSARDLKRLPDFIQKMWFPDPRKGGGGAVSLKQPGPSTLVNVGGAGAGGWEACELCSSD